MAQLVVRNLDEAVKERLRKRAAHNGRSMEEEVRDILRAALATEEQQSTRLGSWFASRFTGIGLTDEIAELHGHPAQPAGF